MLIRKADFKGQIPRLHPRLLPVNYAQVAKNTRLEDGAIGPIRAPINAHQFPSQPQSFIKFGGEFVAFDQPNVNATVGPVAQDRLYYTGDGFPKMRVGSTDYTLGINPPTERIILTRIPSPDGEGPITTAETITYVYTYVTSFGEESAPSPPSELITVAAGDSIDVAVLAPLQTGRSISFIRIYRSKTSLAGVTDYYFVTELNAVTQTFRDSLALPLVESLSTSDFDLPEPTMLGLIALPNGNMAAHTGRELLFCEPYQPHAWPVKYRLTTDTKIVGLGAFGTIVAVMTEGAPYIVQGSDPSLMVMEKLENTLPCLTRFSIVDLGYSVAYASYEGLVVVSQGGASVVTRTLFTEEQWRAMRPETIRAAQLNGRYAFSYQPTVNGPRRFGIIDLSGEQPFYIEADAAPERMHFDAAGGSLFFTEGTGTVKQFDPKNGPTVEKQIWRSKRNTLQGLENFGAILVEADDVPAQKAVPADPDCLIRVYADGKLIHQLTKLNQAARLPSGFLSDKWEVEIEGYAPITGISLAGDISELAEG